jgi:hypothetical protein
MKQYIVVVLAIACMAALLYYFKKHHPPAHITGKTTCVELEFPDPGNGLLILKLFY